MTPIDSTLLLNICTVFYVVALFAYIFNLPKNSAWLRKSATTVAATGFLAQLFGLTLRWGEAGLIEVAAFERSSSLTLTGYSYWVVFTQHPPWSNLYEIMVYMSFGLVLVFLVNEVRWKVPLVNILALTLALLALGMASLSDSMITPLVPALKSWWIMIHVISASIAYSCGTIAAVFSLLYLLVKQKGSLIQKVAAGTMLLNAFLTFLLLGGFSFFKYWTFSVSLFRPMGVTQVQVGRMIGESFKSIRVVSPGVGIMLFAAVISMLIFAVVAFRFELGVRLKGFYLGAAFLPLAAIGLLVFNLGTNKFTMPSTEVLAQMMPPAPWVVNFASATWSLGMLFVIVFGLVCVGAFVCFPQWLSKRMPPAEKLDNIAYANILVSFFLMAVVLVTGALWAHYAWGRYWAWDPKETGALVIWLVYALYLHTRITYGMAGTVSALICILGFFVIIAGFLGVNLGWFSEGLHSYGSS